MLNSYNGYAIRDVIALVELTAEWPGLYVRNLTELPALSSALAGHYQLLLTPMGNVVTAATP